MACHQLGFQDAVETRMSVAPVTTERVWLDNLQCTAREGHLGDCPGAMWGVVSESCNLTNNAHVVCAGKTNTPAIA